MPVTSATRETAQPAEASETAAPSQTGQDVPGAREETLSTSRMSAGASEDAVTQEESRCQKLRTGLSHKVRITGPCPAAWHDEPPGGSQVPPEGSRDPRPGREPRPPWTASPRWSEGEATRRRSGNGRTQQQRGAARKQQTAAGRCEHEQMGRVTSAAHQKQPADGYELQRACLEVRELYSNILGTRQRLSCALGRGSTAADAIKSHRRALLSEMRPIKGAASREAQMRGWGLIEIEDLVRGMLAETQCTLREADSTLYERKAAHHAACVEILAGEASEALNGTRCWSRQDCTGFRKELDWELQAFRRANAELELLGLLIDKKQAAHLRAEGVGAAAHHARQVVERVLWDHDYGWEEPQRLGLDHHQPICPEESCEQGGRRGVQAGSVADGEGGPQRVVQMEDEIWGLQKWAWYPPREAEVDSGGWLERVEAGHSEAWASEPADLARHWLGETKDAPEELLRTVQEPGEEAGRPRLQEEFSEAPRELAIQRGEHEGSSELGGDDSSRTRHHADLHRDEDRDTEMVETERPRPYGASSEAPREQVLQGDKREGWPGSCKRAQRQVDLSRRAGTAVSKKRKLPSGSERASEAKRRPAQRPSCEARTCDFICRREAAGEAAQDEQSGSQEDATPTAAEKDESGDESDLLTEDRGQAGLRGSADRGSYGSQGWDPGGLLMEA
jgi:hypothetical protein